MNRKNVILYVLTAILLGFVALTIAVKVFPVPFIDREFSEEVQENASPFLDKLMEAISWFGTMPYSLIIVLCTAALFYLFSFRKEAYYLILTLLSGAITRFTKALFDRPRPTKNLVRIVEKASNQSFPSGHTLFYVVFFGFLTFLMVYHKSLPKWIRISVSFISMFMIFSIPLSRVYLGAHWFTDVLGGFMLGLLYLSLLGFLYMRKKNAH